MVALADGFSAIYPSQAPSGGRSSAHTDGPVGCRPTPADIPPGMWVQFGPPELEEAAILEILRGLLALVEDLGPCRTGPISVGSESVLPTAAPRSAQRLMRPRRLGHGQ